jgi:hypothetical protein
LKNITKLYIIRIYIVLGVSIMQVERYDSNGLTINNCTFVSVGVQEFLLDNGWVLISDSYKTVPVSKHYKKGIMASQHWVKENNRSIKLNINFEDNNSHSFELWYSKESSETMKLLQIRASLRKRNLAK